MMKSINSIHYEEANTFIIFIDALHIIYDIFNDLFHLETERTFIKYIFNHFFKLTNVMMFRNEKKSTFPAICTNHRQVLINGSVTYPFRK